MASKVRSITCAVALGAILPGLGATIMTHWVMTPYLVAMATTIPLAGWAADRFGGKRVWLLSLAVVVVASALCGLAWSAGSLVVFRVLQGIGAGMIAPAGSAVLARIAGRRSTRLVGAPLTLGLVLGAIVGQPWVFYVNVPIGALALVWSWQVMKNEPARRREQRDPVGLLLLAAAVGLLVFGLSELGDPSDFGWRGAAFGLVGGPALLVLFLTSAMRTDRPRRVVIPMQRRPDPRERLADSSPPQAA